MIGTTASQVSFSSDISINNKEEMGIAFKNKYQIECFDSEGNLKWEETVYNTVVNTGLNDILDKYYKGSTYTATHYVGLVSGTPTIAASDTSSSHAGWTEITAYSNANRPTLTLGTVASQSVDNSASKAVFNINGTATVGGAFVITDNTVGGTTGTLIGAAAFSAGNRSVLSGDTLNVTVTLTAASA